MTKATCPLANWPRNEAHRCRVCDRDLATHTRAALDACDRKVRVSRGRPRVRK